MCESWSQRFLAIAIMDLARAGKRPSRWKVIPEKPASISSMRSVLTGWDHPSRILTLFCEMVSDRSISATQLKQALVIR